MRSLPLTYHLVHPKQVGGVNNIASWLSFSAALVSGFHEAELPLDDAKRVLHLGTDAGFHVFDVDGRFVLARMLLQGFYLAGTLGDQPVHIHLGQLLALWRSLGSRHRLGQVAPLHEADYPAD